MELLEDPVMLYLLSLQGGRGEGGGGRGEGGGGEGGGGRGEEERREGGGGRGEGGGGRRGEEGRRGEGGEGGTSTISLIKDCMYIAKMILDTHTCRYI